MTFEYVLAVLRARWLVATIAFTVIFGSVAVYTWVTPKQYMASASVVLDIKNPDFVAGGAPTVVGSPTYMLTQIEVIQSTRVAERVVTNLKLDQVPSLRDRWMKTTGGIGNLSAWIASLIRSNLEARPQRGSNIITIYYTAEDPVFAANLANAFVRAYLEISLELRTRPAREFNEQFDVNAKSVRERYEAAQRKLSEFQQREGLIVTDERLDIETTRLNALSAQLLEMQAAISDASSRRSAALANPEQSPDILSNPMVASLRSEISKQESQLEQISSRLGDKHPQVIELRTSLEDMRRKLATETRRAASSLGVNNTVISARLAQTRADLDAQRAKVLRMKTLRDEAALLERDVEVAQRELEGVTVRMQSANLESQSPQANVAPLEAANPPSFHIKPRASTNLALGGLLGAAIALALAFLVEMVDRRLRTARDVDVAFDLPAIGSIPNFKTKKDKGRSMAANLRLLNPTLNASK